MTGRSPTRRDPPDLGNPPPLVKWQGSKRQMVPLLSAVVRAAFDTPSAPVAYIEPFVGAGASFLGLLAAGALPQDPRPMLTDACADVIRLHRWVRASPAAVDAELAAMPATSTGATYAVQRGRFNLEPPRTAVHAARMIWLNRAGFNGLYRVSSGGAYNVPRGDTADVVLPSLAWLRAVSTRLQRADIVLRDFVATSPRAPSLIYCDPPYLDTFSAYTAQGFDADDHRDLARRAETWASHGHTVLLSNSAVAAGLYPASAGWVEVCRPEVRRSSGAKADRRGVAEEIMMAIGPADVVAAMGQAAAPFALR